MGDAVGDGRAAGGGEWFSECDGFDRWKQGRRCDRGRAVSVPPHGVPYPSYVRSSASRKRWDLCAVEATHRGGPPHARDPGCWLVRVHDLFVDSEEWPDEALAAARVERDAGATPRARLDVAFARYRQIPFPDCEELEQHCDSARDDFAILDAELASWVTRICTAIAPAARASTSSRRTSRASRRSTIRSCAGTARRSRTCSHLSPRSRNPSSRAAEPGARLVSLGGTSIVC